MALFTALGLSIAAALATVGVTVTAATVTATLNFIALSIVTTALSLVTNILFAPKPQGVGVTATKTVRSATSPARWLMGQKRVGGILSFVHVNSSDTDDVDEGGVFLAYPNNDVYTHLVYVLGKGEMESVDGIWIDGTFIDLQERTQAPRPQEHWLSGATLTGAMRPVPTYLTPKSGSPYYQKIWVKPYLKADGVLAPELHRNSTIPQNNYADGRLKILADYTPAAVQSPVAKEWDTDRNMNGLSYVYVCFRRPDYISGGKLKVERNPFSGGFPEIQFLVKGNKITWPGQVTKKWTDNVAAWRHWAMTSQPTANWHFIDPALINGPSFTSAFNKCEEMVDEVLPQQYSEYETEEKRYAANGLILADDEQQAIFDALDFAWQGNVIYHQGEYFFRPGEDTPVVMDLNQEDIAAPIYALAAPSLRDRLNQITLSLDQSKDHEWSETPLNPYIDVAAVAEDGSPLNKNLGVSAFVNAPIRGAAIMAIQLKRARQYQRYTVALFFKDNDMADTLAKLALKPLDVIRVVRDPEQGFTNKLMRIAGTRTSTTGGLTKTIECEEYNPNTYSDDLVLPPLKTRTVSIIAADTFVAPFQVTVRVIEEADDEGVLQKYLLFGWFGQLAYTEVQWRVKNTDTTIDPEFESAVVPGKQARIPITPGTYEYRLRHIADANFSNPSEWTALQEVIVTVDTRVIGQPVIDSLVPLPNGYKASWTLPTDKFYLYTEVQEYDTGTSQWITVGKVSADEYIDITVEANTSVRVRIRHVTRARMDGDWSEEQVVTTLASVEGDTILDVRRDPNTGEVRVIIASGTWETLVEDTGNANTTYSDMGLEPSTLRNYRVSAINPVGTGPPSEPDDAETDPA